MPVIRAYGIPADVEECVLEHLIDDVRLAVSKVKYLGVEKKQVSVFLPPDRVQKGLGEEIIIFVDGLFADPKRTDVVRWRLAQAIVRVFQGYFRKTELIECFVQPFNPRLGFSSSLEKDMKKEVGERAELAYRNREVKLCDPHPGVGDGPAAPLPESLKSVADYLDGGRMLLSEAVYHIMGAIPHGVLSSRVEVNDDKCFIVVQLEYNISYFGWRLISFRDAS